MAKDRFKTRASYDPTFKFNAYENTISDERSISSEQVTLMKKMYRAETVNDWEKQFIEGCLKRNTLTDKQKEKLNLIYKKTKWIIKN